MKKQKDYRKGFFAVVYRKELSLKKKPQKEKIKYLLLKRKLHWKGWEFPKGGIKDKEFMNEAIKREIKEETGLSPRYIKKHISSGKFKYSKEYKDRPGFIGQTYSLYSIEVKDKKIKIDEKEHSNYNWFEFEKAFKKLKWSNQKKCLQVVNKYLIK